VLREHGAVAAYRAFSNDQHIHYLGRRSSPRCSTSPGTTASWGPQGRGRGGGQLAGQRMDHSPVRPLRAHGARLRAGSGRPA
jgi:hypothetical protein